MDRFRATGEPINGTDGRLDTQAYIRALNREHELLEIERRVLERPGE